MTYRYPNGTFAGLVVESNALLNARMRVALSGTNRGLLFVSGNVFDLVLATCRSSNVCCLGKCRRSDRAADPNFRSDQSRLTVLILCALRCQPATSKSFLCSDGNALR